MWMMGYYDVSDLNLLHKGDGSDVQSALTEWTTQRKLPIVFIGGNHIGGDESMFLAFACFSS